MNIKEDHAPVEFTQPPFSFETKENAELELSYKHHLLPDQPPMCRNQLYPEGAVNLPRNTQYVNNLTYPDPYTMSNSVLQYDQVRVNDYLNKTIKPHHLQKPDMVSSRYSENFTNYDNYNFIKKIVSMFLIILVIYLLISCYKK